MAQHGTAQAWNIIKDNAFEIFDFKRACSLTGIPVQICGEVKAINAYAFNMPKLRFESLGRGVLVLIKLSSATFK